VSPPTNKQNDQLSILLTRQILGFDDYLDSQKTVEETVKLKTGVIIIHENGGFHLRDFISNSADVLSKIPSNLLLKKAIMEIGGETDVQRVLGVLWDSTIDCFCFTTNLKKIPGHILDGE
jgi:hypothetical protein